MVYTPTLNSIAFGTQWGNISLEKARNTADGQISFSHDVATRKRAHVLVVCNSCIFRAPPVHAGSDVYLPACFPPESLQNDTKPASLVLSDEDMGEVRLYNFIFQLSFTHLRSYIPSLCTQILSFSN